VAITPDVERFLTLLRGTGVDDATAIRALAVGYAESGASATKVGLGNKDGTIDYGFMQINSVHFPEPMFKKNGWNALTMLQLGKNIDAANYLSKGWKDWTPWVTFNRDLYLKHIDKATKDLAEWKKLRGIAPGGGIDLGNVGGTDPENPGNQVAGAITAPVQLAKTAYGTVTNPHNWMRLAYGLAGLGLVYAAVAQLGKGMALPGAIGAATKIVTKGKV